LSGNVVLWALLLWVVGEVVGKHRTTTHSPGSSRISCSSIYLHGSSEYPVSVTSRSKPSSSTACVDVRSLWQSTWIQEFRSMTWLSRLLPQSPSLQRVANRNNRTRQAQRRRRMSTLETLEGRTLLSNVVTSIFAGTLAPLPALPAGAHGLEITTDTHNDTFTVTENANGTVTLLGNSKAQINSLPIGTPFTTSSSLPISAIYFNIAAGTSVNTNSITLTGHGTVQNVLFYE